MSANRRHPRSSAHLSFLYNDIHHCKIQTTSRTCWAQVAIAASNPWLATIVASITPQVKTRYFWRFICPAPCQVTNSPDPKPVDLGPGCTIGIPSQPESVSAEDAGVAAVSDPWTPHAWPTLRVIRHGDLSPVGASLRSHAPGVGTDVPRAWCAKRRREPPRRPRTRTRMPSML